MSTNHYITLSGSAATSLGTGNIIVYGNADYSTQHIQFQVGKDRRGITPMLYFTYVKKKFKLLERHKLNKRLKFVEAAFEEAVENGQNALGDKILNDLIIATRESVMLAKGITKYVEREDVTKYKNKLRDGHISDTLLKSYTRIIPKKVMSRLNEIKSIFDDFVIFHYYNEDQKDVKEMSSSEKAKMRDPVLFGIIKENDRLYFIADWEDEYCDLTFDEMIGVMGKDRLGKIENKVRNFKTK